MLSHILNVLVEALLYNMDVVPCNVAIWLTTLGFSILGVTTLTSSARAFFLWRLSEDKTRTRSDSFSFSSSWFVRNRRYIQNDKTYLFVIISHILLIMAFHFVCLSIFNPEHFVEFVHREELGHYCYAPTYGMITYALLVVYFCSVFLIVAFVYKKYLSGLRDGLKARRELKLVACIWTVVFLVWVPIAVVHGNAWKYASFPSTLGHWFHFWAGNGYAIYASFQKPKTMEFDCESLEQLLKDKPKKDKFFDFLKSEWSSENLLFFEGLSSSFSSSSFLLLFSHLICLFHRSGSIERIEGPERNQSTECDHFREILATPSTL
jgi:hypothetical protein